MQLEPIHKTTTFAKVLGMLLGYLLFTTILYFVLTFLGKFPTHWTYFHLTGITLFIGIIGYGMQTVFS